MVFGRAMTAILVTCSLVLALWLASGQASPMPAVQHCNPDMLEELPPKLRKICEALATLNEFQSNVEQYVDEKVLNLLAAYRDNVPLMDSGVKRQDVDHVFLRFGRRR